MARDDFYQLLGVSRTASPGELKRAFLARQRDVPAERDPDLAARLAEAYEVLSDPASRRDYDDGRTLEEIYELRALRAEMTAVTKAPTLGRINGFGWTLLGRREHHAPSDTYVATRVFCVLFVPVFPTDAWRVRQVGSRTWTFLGKVPLSPLARQLQKAAVVGAALIVTWGLWPRSSTAPEPARAASRGTVIGDPADGLVRVEVGIPTDRVGAPALGVWIDRERSALQRLRDSLAQTDAQIAAQERAIRQPAPSSAPTADPRGGAKSAMRAPEPASAASQTDVAAALNQLYGLRRSLLARLGQRERELADSVRAFEGN